MSSNKFAALTEALEQDARQRRFNEPVTELLWQHSSALHSRLPLDDTAVLSMDLHSACSDGKDEKVCELLLAGADATFKDQSSNTCLHTAVMFDQASVLKILLASSVNPNVTDSGGLSPLHWACYSGNVDMVSDLISHGALVNANDENGIPPLFTAVQHGHIMVTLAMLHAQARVNQVDRLGRTPLMVAASRGHDETVRMLLVYGADPSIIDLNGLTAHDHARGCKRIRTLDILLQSSLNRTNSSPLHVKRCLSLKTMGKTTRTEIASRTEMASLDTWEGHQQQLYYRANKEIVCDMFVRLDDFRKNHLAKQSKQAVPTSTSSVDCNNT
mmetsp:Transcript_26134/g.49647  ORF Transcript_26134/g.49647 Transcript_26134/m.49647 type:complete len:329 (+) Transcript_26134:74-1060(+)